MISAMEKNLSLEKEAILEATILGNTLKMGNDLKQRFQQQGMILGGVNYVEKVEEHFKQWNIRMD